MSDKHGQEAPTDPLQLAAPGNDGQKSLSSPDNELRNSARNKAKDDVREIKRRSDEGKIVRVMWNLVEERAAVYARSHVKDTLPADEYDLRIHQYEELYQNNLQELLEGDPSIHYITTSEQLRLREYANEDRRASFSEGAFHIRDIAVLRVLMTTGYSAEVGLEMHETLHTLASFYQDCYTHPREEGRWPEQNSFRSQRDDS